MPFQPRPELIRSLQLIAEDLFAVTAPARVTIRVDATNDPDFPVLGEARAEGVSSLTGGMTLTGYKPIDIHTAPTLRSLRDARQMIIQRDVRVDPPQIPELIELYGCASQMLAPTDWKGRFVGAISVHNVEPRDWTDDERTSLQHATQQVERELDHAAWYEVRR